MPYITDVKQENLFLKKDKSVVVKLKNGGVENGIFKAVYIKKGAYSE